MCIFTGAFNYHNNGLMCTMYQCFLKIKKRAFQIYLQDATVVCTACPSGYHVGNAEFCVAHELHIDRMPAFSIYEDMLVRLKAATM